MKRENESERRQAENEVVFRQANQQIQKNLQKLDKSVVADGHPTSLMLTEDIPLHFYCECSNENCRERIEITQGQYEALHKNTSQFVVIPGHEVAEIERIIKTEPTYLVVEKYIRPPKDATKLNKTV